jgi:hypothetical protein
LKKTKEYPEIPFSTIKDNNINSILIETSKLCMKVDPQKRPSPLFILNNLSKFISNRRSEILSNFNIISRRIKLGWKMHQEFMCFLLQISKCGHPFKLWRV